MEFADPQWREIADGYTETLNRLLGQTRTVAGISDVEFAPAAENFEGVANQHLERSRQAGEFLASSIKQGDQEAIDLMGRLVSVDLQVGQSMSASALDDQSSAIESFTFVRDEIDLDDLDAALHGRPVSGGQGGVESRLSDIAESCDKVLNEAEKVLTPLVRSVTSAVSVEQVLDSLASIFQGGGMGDLIHDAKEFVGGTFKAWKRKALDFVGEAIKKLAAWLGLNADDIKDKLRKLLEQQVDRLKDVIAHVLGRDKATRAWEKWIEAVPPPAEDLQQAGLANVRTSESRHLGQVKYASKAVKVLNWVDGLLATLHPAGPLILLDVAAAITAWLVWTPWHHFRMVEDAAI
jgi:hypothetical protein